jgi:hypothetical protein
MSLREIQELFWRAIAWPTGVQDFLDRSDDATRRTFAATFAETPDFDRVARMTVYAEAYFWRLYEVLADQLELTAWIAGGPRFHDFVTDYLLQHPSHDPDVRRFAAAVPAALREHALERSIPGLADVAAVEWALVQAIDGPDDALLPAQALAAIPADAWPSLRLHAVRTATLVPCRPDFDALRRARTAGDAPPSPLALGDPPRSILVWRKPDLDVYTRTVDPAEAAALAALLDARTFADLCHAATGIDAAPQVVVQWLHRWLRDGLVRRIEEDTHLPGR